MAKWSRFLSRHIIFRKLTSLTKPSTEQVNLSVKSTVKYIKSPFYLFYPLSKQNQSDKIHLKKKKFNLIFLVQFLGRSIVNKNQLPNTISKTLLCEISLSLMLKFFIRDFMIEFAFWGITSKSKKYISFLFLSM